MIKSHVLYRLSYALAFQGQLCRGLAFAGQYRQAARPQLRAADQWPLQPSERRNVPAPDASPIWPVAVMVRPTPPPTAVRGDVAMRDRGDKRLMIAMMVPCSRLS